MRLDPLKVLLQRWMPPSLKDSGLKVRRSEQDWLSLARSQCLRACFSGREEEPTRRSLPKLLRIFLSRFDVRRSPRMLFGERLLLRNLGGSSGKGTPTERGFWHSEELAEFNLDTSFAVLGAASWQPWTTAQVPVSAGAWIKVSNHPGLDTETTPRDPLAPRASGNDRGTRRLERGCTDILSPSSEDFRPRLWALENASRARSHAGDPTKDAREDYLVSLPGNLHDPRPEELAQVPQDPRVITFAA